MTAREIWEIGSEAARECRPVLLVAHDGKEFRGHLSYVEEDFVLLDGLGFPCADVYDLVIL